MTRPLRISFEGAVYHVMARGNRRDPIFHTDRDKQIFTAKMSETFQKYSIICYAYCLMEKHYHIFFMTPLGNISAAMHYLNSSYANWFRTKYGIVGNVFQGRFKSILVDRDNYALTLTIHIHLNLPRPGIVLKLGDYSWSTISIIWGYGQTLKLKILRELFSLSLKKGGQYIGG